VRQPVSSLEPDVQIVATPHPDPAQRTAWRRLWALLLEDPIKTNAPSGELVAQTCNARVERAATARTVPAEERFDDSTTPDRKQAD
jgi:hypothetical protein